MEETTRRRGAIVRPEGTAHPGARIAIASEVKVARTNVNPALSSLIEQRDAAAKALDQFRTSDFEQAEIGWAAQIARHHSAIEGIPHVEERGGLIVNGSPIIFSSAKSDSRRLAEQCVATGAADHNPDEEWHATVRAAERFIEIDNRRKCDIAALGDEPQLPDQIREREAELSRALDELDERIDGFPVSSLGDLAAKIECIEGRGLEPIDAAEQIFADVKRLAALEWR